MPVRIQPEGRAVAVIVVFSFTIVISTILFALRIYVRLRVVKIENAFYENFTAALSWLLIVSVSGLAIAGTFYGTGQSFTSIPFQNLEFLMQLYYTYSLGYLVTQVVIKQSTTLMLLRFAVEDYHRKIIYGLTIMIYVVSAIILALCVFQCIPLSFFWTRAAGDLDGRCLSPSVAVKGAAIYSGVVILFDLSMAVLPWIMVRKLQLDLRTRLMVTAVLALGSIASIVTIIRIPFIIELAQRQEPRLESLVDMISCSELVVCVVASSVTTLKPLFQRRSTGTRSRSGKTPVLATIKTSPGSSSAGSAIKESEVQFSTEFYGSAESTK